MKHDLNLLPIKEFSELLSKPESTIRTWKRRGDIPAECFFSIGSTVFVRINVFQDWAMQTA